MIEIVEFKPEFKGLSKMDVSTDKIKFVDKVTRTTSPNDEFDRVITYRNRKGEEYTRI